MSTINSREIVDKIIAGNGYYPGDHMRVVKIVQYENAWGGTAYGLIYEGKDMKQYAASPYVYDPKTIWEYKPAK